MRIRMKIILIDPNDRKTPVNFQSSRYNVSGICRWRIDAHVTHIHTCKRSRRRRTENKRQNRVEMRFSIREFTSIFISTRRQLFIRMLAVKLRAIGRVHRRNKGWLNGAIVIPGTWKRDYRTCGKSLCWSRILKAVITIDIYLPSSFPFNQ